MDVDDVGRALAESLAVALDHPDIDSSEIRETLAKWQAYRDFTEYAAEEVASGDLDTWLEDETQTSDSGS